jgi:hypothetical protein
MEGKTMTEEQQRIAIAKACELTIVSDGIIHHLTPCGVKTERDPEGCLLKECPNYLNDLNAMHEAEKFLNGMDEITYLAKLHNGNRYCSWEGTCATAAQRAEALLRTIGKWEEEK